MAETAKGIWIVTESTEASEVVAEGSRSADDTAWDYDSPDSSSTSPTSRSWTRVNAADLQGNLGEFIEVIEGAVDRAEQS